VRLLLDTHCLIWVLTDAPQLDMASRAVIADADPEMSDAPTFATYAKSGFT
jgi:PIN domain nuclease of toxin-antitoxin system